MAGWVSLNIPPERQKVTPFTEGCSTLEQWPALSAWHAGKVNLWFASVTHLLFADVVPIKCKVWRDNKLRLWILQAELAHHPRRSTTIFHSLGHSLTARTPQDKVEAKNGKSECEWWWRWQDTKNRESFLSGLQALKGIKEKINWLLKHP